MKLEDAKQAVMDAMANAHAVARTFYGKMPGPTAPIVNAARLTVIERALANLMATTSQHEGDLYTKAALELRDYWEEVVLEISS